MLKQIDCNESIWMCTHCGQVYSDITNVIPPCMTILLHHTTHIKMNDLVFNTLNDQLMVVEDVYICSPQDAYDVFHDIKYAHSPIVKCHYYHLPDSLEAYKKFYLTYDHYVDYEYSFLPAELKLKSKEVNVKLKTLRNLCQI